MKKLIALNQIRNASPFWFIALWAAILLADFLNIIPQPDSVIGYRWKVEFALAGLILLTSLVALKFSKNKISFLKFSRPEILWIILPLVLFTAWSGLSLIWAESWRNALHHTLLWTCYIIFYLLVRQIVSRPRLLDISLKCAGAVIIILGLSCIIEYLSKFGNIDLAFVRVYYKHAEASSTLLPIFFALALQTKSRQALLSGAVLLFAWLLILLSFSRTEFIAGSVGIVLFLLFILMFQEWKKLSKKLILILSLLLLAVFITQTSLLSSQNNSTVNRLTNDEHAQSTLRWRFLIWDITFQALNQKPVQGIGADNFVTDYRTLRESYAVLNADDKLLEFDENSIPERTHNEFVQILSELGIVGAFFFSWFLLGVAKLAFLSRKKTVSLLTVAGLAGIFAFLVSSITSSYSFRIPANGVCFFFVLSLAISGLLKEENRKKEERIDFNWLKSKPLFVGFSLIICFAMLTFSAVRGISLMYLQKSLSNSNDVEAEQNIQRAIALDNEEALFKYYYGVRLYNLKRTEEAIPLLRFSINNGIAIPTSYFNLTSAQATAGKTVEVERTFIESLRVYPRSVFLLTAYSSFLRREGRYAQAEIEYEKAFQINPEQAKSWQMAHNDGLEKLSQTANKDNSFVKSMDLKPDGAAIDLLNFQRLFDPKLPQK